MSVYSRAALRTLALHTQHLTHQLPPHATPDQLTSVIEQIGGLQIDTLQRVRRSHYIALWSRAGNYDPDALDTLAYQAPRRLFEYWYHAACLLPLRHYRYLAFRRRQQALKMEQGDSAAQEYRAMMADMLVYIRDGKGVKASEFEDTRAERSGWWDWKPAKIALECLYNQGDLVISERQKFQRVYDLPERVIPAEIDTTLPSDEECYRFILEHSVKALGVCQPAHAGNYAFLRQTQKVIQALRQEGVFLTIQAEGTPAEWLIHRDNLEVLEQIAQGQIQAELTTFLTPFDSLFWGLERTPQLFDFENRIEAYTPAPKRRWGYLCYPILYKDRLVGRFDPKLERKTGVLRLEALHLEPGVILDDALIQAVGGAMRQFMDFHAAQELVIERSNPDPFGEQLVATVRG